MPRGPKGRFWIVIGLAVGSFLVPLIGPNSLRAAVTRDEVERAIRDGVRFLKQEQKGDGSWADVNGDARSGNTSLVTLALLTAGEKPDSPTVRKAIDYLRTLGPDQLNSTYSIALQTMVYAAAEPERDMLRIAANVNWLESAQIRSGDPIPWPGSWSYSSSKRASPATTPIPSTPCSDWARPARSVSPSNPRYGPWREPTGSIARKAMGAGPTRPIRRLPPPA